MCCKHDKFVSIWCNTSWYSDMYSGFIFLNICDLLLLSLFELLLLLSLLFYDYVYFFWLNRERWVLTFSVFYYFFCCYYSLEFLRLLAMLPKKPVIYRSYEGFSFSLFFLLSDFFFMSFLLAFRGVILLFYFCFPFYMD